MSALQKKVLAAIQETSASLKLDADIEYNYSNTGHIYFRVGFETKANLHFDFQGHSFTIAYNSGSLRAGYFGTPAARFLIEASDGPAIINFLRFIETNLTAAVQVRPAKKARGGKR